MTGMPVRIAVAGAGMIARVHADAARRAGARIVGVSASTPQRAEQAARELGAERAYASSEQLAADPEVDVLHICTPNHLHRPLAEAALRAGKHVVCEKPLATSGADAAALAELAEQAGAVAAVPFVYRYHAMAAEARARVQSGALGDLRLMHGHYLQDWLSEPTDDNWRVDPALGGPSRAFADIGSHWCDLVEWVTGHRISELTATADTVLAERHATGAKTFSGDPAAAAHGASPDGASPMRAVHTEDAAQILFRTDRGATGSVLVSQISPGRKNRLWFEVDGARASVCFDQENPETLVIGRRESTELLRRDAPGLSAAAARLNPVPAGHPLGYQDCFAAFVADVHAAVRARREGADPGAPAYPTFADAARSARITDAVLDSARQRAWRPVPAGRPFDAAGLAADTSVDTKE